MQKCRNTGIIINFKVFQYVISYHTRKGRRWLDLLAGPRGFLKVESTWNGNKLITIVLKGGTGD
jgi:hypothetical protein